MSARTLVLATRRSALALAQARAFARDLITRWPDVVVEELQVVTKGDRITDAALSELGGKGLFVREIEQALLEREAHLAVHSFKDVPIVLSDAFAIACVPPREDARDVLVGPAHAPNVTLAALAAGSTVGTSSLRRSVQLLQARPDLVVVPLRGNVDTRLRRVDAGAMAAIVVARAGLARLGLAARAGQVLPPEVMIPAPSQGALAIQCLADDEPTRALLSPLSHPETEIAVACERGVMAAVGGDCTLPLGAYARRRDGSLVLSAFLARADGSRLARAERSAPWPPDSRSAEAIGRDAGAELSAAVGHPASSA
jgi:hydroxymethylbilane synthase